MLTESPLLASHADREFTAAQLQEHVGAGRLTLEEFSDRAAAVYQARTVGELQMLLSDLPVVAATAEPQRSSDWLRWAGVAAVVLLVVILAVALLSTGVWGSGGGHPMGGMMQDMMGGTGGMGG